MRLMREVECEEKATQQAKEEADRSSFDILVKIDERKQAKLHAEETNDMVCLIITPFTQPVNLH